MRVCIYVIIDKLILFIGKCDCGGILKHNGQDLMDEVSRQIIKLERVVIVQEQTDQWKI